jgi:hypothetical protein
MTDNAIPTTNTAGDTMKEEYVVYASSNHDGGLEDDATADAEQTKDDNILPQEKPMDETQTALSDIEIGKETITTTLPRKTKPFIVLVACCAALGGLIFGYDIAGKKAFDVKMNDALLVM